MLVCLEWEGIAADKSCAVGEVRGKDMRRAHLQDGDVKILRHKRKSADILRDNATRTHAQHRGNCPYPVRRCR